MGFTHCWDPATANAVQLVVVTFTVGYMHAFGVHSTHGWDTFIATRFMWVTPTVGGLSPLLGSDINTIPSVGYVYAFGVHSAHDWDTVIATRFICFFTIAVGFATWFDWR